MKKVLGVAAFAVLGVVALSSCRKDYECVSDGYVVDTCTNCRSNGIIKASFDSNCTNYYDGTVRVKK